MNKISKTIEFFERLTPGHSKKSRGMGKSQSKNALEIGVYRANQNFEPRTGSNCLFLIDPQNDFIIDGGSLQVAGALEDSKRTASFIMKNLDNIGDIYCSLDTHMQFHIAHKAFWHKKVLDVNENEEYDWSKARIETIESFEQIPHRAVIGHIKSEDNRTVIRYFAQKKEFQKWGEHYTKTLEEGSLDDGVPGTLTLTIWPDHCLIGSNGHNVQADMFNALQAWEMKSQRSVTYILKGKNSKTEHYSALKAEVIVPNDPATKFNTKLYKSLDKHSKIYIAGQARSHCVNMTTRHLVQKLQKDKKRTDKVVLLKGSMSDVYQCEAIGEVFIKDMEKAGVQTLDIHDIKPLEGDWSKQPIEEILEGIHDKFDISKKPEEFKTPKKPAVVAEEEEI